MRSGKRRRRGSGLRSLLHTLYWVAVSNAALLVVIAASGQADWLGRLVPASLQGAIQAGMASAALPAPPPQRSPPAWAFAVEPVRKAGMSVTRVEKSGITMAFPSQDAVDEPDGAPEDAVEPIYSSGSESGALAAGPETVPMKGEQIAPILGRVPGTDRVRIGNFTSVQMAGGADECLSVGSSMLADTGMPGDRLQIVAQSKLITIARICAANGSVVISCRGRQITVSPRRPAPNDRCERV